MVNSSTSVDWAVVSFVEKGELSENNLIDFFTKLNENLAERAEAKFLSLSLSEYPRSVEYVPNDYYQVRDVLRQLRSKFPNCIVVYSVLPHRESEEYAWIKQLTNELGFARQCILKENVESYFEKCCASVNDVCDNMAVWLSNRIRELAFGSRFACVHLGSKFEVLQACKKFNEKLINESYTVKLTPNNVAIKEKFKEIYN